MLLAQEMTVRMGNSRFPVAGAAGSERDTDRQLGYGRPFVVDPGSRGRDPRCAERPRDNGSSGRRHHSRRLP
jgi:hypothetical protein